jgi:hypothetical protein
VDGGVEHFGGSDQHGIRDILLAQPERDAGERMPNLHRSEEEHLGSLPQMVNANVVYHALF